MTPTDQTFIVSATGSSEVAGRLAIARYDHKLVSIGTNKVLCIGGLGRSLSNETNNRVVNEVEIYDHVRKSWAPAGRLKFGRVQPLVEVYDNKVYVFGGHLTTNPATVDTNVPVEVYDLKTGKWSIWYEGSESSRYDSGVARIPNKEAIVIFGGMSGSSVLSSGRIFVPAVQGRSANEQLNDPARVLTVESAPTGTTLVLTGGKAKTFGRGINGVLTKIDAATNTHKGPYLIDPQGHSLSDIETTLSVAVPANSQQATLNVANAAYFPDEEGWLMINYGTATQTVVKYLGRVSSSSGVICPARGCPCSRGWSGRFLCRSARR
jgi:hypothetical protein